MAVVMRDKLVAAVERSDDTDAPTPPPPPPSINACTTVSELQAALAHLNAQESLVSSRLQTLLLTQSELSHSFSRLDLIRAHLGTQVVAARSLSNNILSTAATTANRVSSAVKRLDTEQSRVKATLEVVDQVSELKACVLGVTSSMGAPQDWETAASYLYRASKIPAEIVRGEFAEEMVASAEVPDPPAVTLENAAESLCGLFLREFEKAAEVADGEKVTRFFKLFPLIGRAHTGLEVYGKYVCAGVSSRARAALNEKSGDFFYASAMTRLFEHIATIVEQHGALVDRHYGEGKMVKVIERLQIEADTQGGIIIDMFMDEKTMDRKLTDIKSYAFSFLVQSFLPGPRGALGGTPRSGSPAPGAMPSQDVEDEGIDVKEVDLLLTEIGVMLGRWSLYCRFLARKCQPTDPLILPPVISNSALLQKVHTRLVNPFNTMTTFFCRRSVEKAFQLDEAPTDLSLSLNLSASTSSNPPFITSAVDDVMYIVSKLLQRSIETSQRALVTSVISTVSRVLGSDFIGMIQRKMRDESYPRSTSANTPPPDEKVLGFLVLINNLDTAAEYIHRIISGFVPKDLKDLFPFEDEAESVADALKNLETSFEAKTGELVGDGIMVVFNQVVKPRLRPLLAESWSGVDYVVSEETGGGGMDEEEELGEIVKARFQGGWEQLVMPLKRIMTEKTFNRLLVTTANYFSKLLEKRIWGYSGRINELGAIRLERDVAGVVGVVVRGGRYGVRDTFARCTQICLVVNMEEDEVREILKKEGDESGVEWKLEVEERARAREMVIRRV
ncbi:COG4 transport protein-domain-containing protein [Sphaerosporella brunnea]|uniref:Conserved oligomeric Golgi complex subunit 4 n=1 Tax=Sphaerosporella brunnea TaxID=1250544 RepID=A0A5J5F7U0_9PEZI|nr:COG4 transport protein-domain-containing protein [Sphaerosporella brunnea]